MAKTHISEQLSRAKAIERLRWAKAMRRVAKEYAKNGSPGDWSLHDELIEWAKAMEEDKDDWFN